MSLKWALFSFCQMSCFVEVNTVFMGRFLKKKSRSRSRREELNCTWDIKHSAADSLRRPSQYSVCRLASNVKCHYSWDHTGLQGSSHLLRTFVMSLIVLCLQGEKTRGPLRLYLYSFIIITIFHVYRIKVKP